MAPRMSSAFHYSARREEDAKENSSEVAEKEGFLGTGLSHLYAIPVGVAFAVPALEFNWYLVNEETLVRLDTGVFAPSSLLRSALSFDGL